MKTFPLNAWYACAYDVEVRHELLSRTVCNQKLVIYRKQDGTPVILEDACWHRLLPLSQGRLKGDELQCGYHGLVYNADGRCTHMPSQQTINPSACVRAYPAVEKHRFLWVWPGDPALADAAKVPDLHWNDDPAWAGDGKMIRVNCDYRLVLDNLMDLTHETYVHDSSIGQEAVAEAPFVATHGDRTATVTRWLENIEAPPFWGRADSPRAGLRRAGGPLADHPLRGTGHHRHPTWAWRLRAAAHPEGRREQGVNGFVLNTVTPETAKTCLYFWAFARNYALRDQRLTHELREGVARIFREDELILEAQQQAIDEHPGYTFYNLNIDAGTMWMRRLIDKMVAKEAPDGSAPSAPRVVPIRTAA